VVQVRKLTDAERAAVDAAPAPGRP
jgi:hypothetical protein